MHLVWRKLRTVSGLRYLYLTVLILLSRLYQRTLSGSLGFDEVVLMFDMDKVGQEAAKAVAEVFPPGFCKIARLGKKDANLVLTEDGGSGLVDAIWRARVHRPDGIIAGEDTWELS
jgi:twinkle protein